MSKNKDKIKVHFVGHNSEHVTGSMTLIEMGKANKKILISLGGTFEPIDPVRGITNQSSGKMGLELAKQAYIRGADLTLLVANVSVKIPSIFNVIHDF